MQVLVTIECFMNKRNGGNFLLKAGLSSEENKHQLDTFSTFDRKKTILNTFIYSRHLLEKFISNHIKKYISLKG